MNQVDKTYVIVITGGIATGKSEVSKYLKELGYTVLDSDQIVHEGYKRDTELYKILVSVFSQGILDQNDNIDRQKLGKIVLNDDEELSKLNRLVHKYVVNELISGVDNCKDKYVFLDIPLFFEQKNALESMNLRYDEIWLVYVNIEIQEDRLKQRAMSENKDVNQTLSIIKKQMSIEEKKALADVIIYNEKTIDNLKKEIKLLLKNLEMKISSNSQYTNKNLD